MTRLVALYVIVEPALRNAMQIAAGVVAVAADELVIGVALVGWAVVDLIIKATAGAMLLARRR